MLFLSLPCCFAGVKGTKSDEFAPSGRKKRGAATKAAPRFYTHCPTL